MKLILEVKSGFAEGNRTWLGVGQTQTVGRSRLADLAIENDVRMSSVHFEISCGRKECSLRDLNSSNGTFVNGTRVTEAILLDGDQIQAGTTKFLVSLEVNIQDDETKPSPKIVTQEDTTRDSIKKVSGVNETEGAEDPRVTEEQLLQENLQTDDDMFATLQEEPLEDLETSAYATVVGDIPIQPNDELQFIDSMVLEVEGGVNQGKQIRLTPGEHFTIGRSSKSQQELPGDSLLSNIHFSVFCEDAEARIRDEKSSNGTYLNGQRIKSAELCDGDRISAGQTKFNVKIFFCTNQVAKVSEGKKKAYVVSAQTRPADQTDVSASNARPLRFRRFPIRSQLTFIVGVNAAFDVAEIARNFSALAPMYLVVSNESSDVGSLSSMGEQSLLFDWLPAESANELSPVLVGPVDLEASRDVLTESWGQNLLLCLFDQREHQEVASQLSDFASQRYPHLEARNIARFQPNEIVEFASNSDPGDVLPLTRYFDVMFVEVFQGDRWCAFVDEEHVSGLSDIGFEEAASWESV